MDLNHLLALHQVSLMMRDQAANPEERRAHEQFARDYAADIRTARDKLGAGRTLVESHR
jgi:hypothetical protein